MLRKWGQSKVCSHTKITRDPRGDGNVLYLYFIKIKALSMIYSTTVLKESTLGENWVKSAWAFSVISNCMCLQLSQNKNLIS